ncbi:phenylacetic acid degradation protein [Streptomyces minutiscleroticus]|uniref:Phenylacetic acid degradation protein n=1 Tax=Streptomyces minutiscleroticus TaxID=68238 RepID=A0A918NVS6_9ACTN|nr:2Fe-2S iron-sulfur cluster-binding protein [Streptomyces minutiscleroticus]GGY00535.1 phenylacetic acid degradation protein [Streptomyces minutiscleroticus]
MNTAVTGAGTAPAETAPAGARAGRPRTPSSPAAGPRTGWHRLTVAEVRRLTEEAVAVTLDVPDGLRAAFAHRPGRHVVVRHRRAGVELRRCYSVCPPPDDPDAFRLVIKRGGPDGFGAYATTALAPGECLEVSPPTGAFALPDLPGAHHVLVAGGSGVTPLAAMAAAVLREDPACRVSLVHAVPTAATALLADELTDLKDRYVDRFTALHVLTREHRGSDLLSGRVDAPKLRRLLTALDALPAPGTAYALCGPPGLVATARRALTEWGADPASVRCEPFTPGATPHDAPPVAVAPPAAGPAGPAEETRITAVLGGRRGTVPVRPQDQVILDALLRARPDVPYACRDGVCGSCRAKVLSGEVALGRQYALDPQDLAAGYTLVCRARPRTAEVTLDFDA